MRALLAGVFETPYARRLDDASTLSLLASAAAGALDDAGLQPADVDALAVSSFTLAPDRAIDVAWRLGLRTRWLLDSHTGGASGIDMLHKACRAVEAGDAEVVLVLAGDLLDKETFRRLVDGFNSATRDHLTPLPHVGPNALFALLTRRQMGAHGLGRETYGKIAVAQRQWAALNPGAVYREPLSVADYLRAPIVAEPLGRYDCVPVVSGANALVVTTAVQARRPAVSMRAHVASFNHDQQQGDGLTTALRQLAPALWAAAGAQPDEVDVISVYDDYPAMILVQLADLGFAGADLARFVDERIATRALPVNTSGGQLSAGQAGAAGGLHGVVELVRQLRGEAGERQVENARLAVASGYGMVAYRHGACANAVVLGREA